MFIINNGDKITDLKKVLKDGDTIINLDDLS